MKREVIFLTFQLCNFIRRNQRAFNFESSRQSDYTFAAVLSKIMNRVVYKKSWIIAFKSINKTFGRAIYTEC